MDQAALSPPEGYKDGGLQQALGGVLGSHIFGAQHIQQLQVIQRLQAKRAAMLAAQRSNNNGTNPSSSSKSIPQPLPTQNICTECAECTECAAKQEHDEGMSPFIHYKLTDFFQRPQRSSSYKNRYPLAWLTSVIIKTDSTFAFRSKRNCEWEQKNCGRSAKPARTSNILFDAINNGWKMPSVFRPFHYTQYSLAHPQYNHIHTV